MRVHLGPWKWNGKGDTPHYGPPAKVLGTIDLGRLPEMGVGGADRRGCLCWTDGALLPSEYEVLGEGDLSEIKATGRLQNVFLSALGYRPQGDTLADLVMDMLIGGADPAGLDGPMPLMPSVNGWMDLHADRRVKSQRFEWDTSPHRDKVQTLIRADFAQLMDAADKGFLKDSSHHLRVLDAWCDKYGVKDWKEFVPTQLQKDVPGRLLHETTVLDDFNRADSSTSLGTASGGFSWSVEGTWGITSNAAYLVTTGSSSSARAESDLSSSDNFAQLLLASAVTTRPSPVCRYQSGARTGYFGRKSNLSWAIFKMVTGSFTSIGTPSDNTSGSYTCKLEANGSSITGYSNGVGATPITDTAIATGLRTGMRTSTTGTGDNSDNFQGGDISAGTSILYTQFYSTFRGQRLGTWLKGGS